MHNLFIKGMRIFAFLSLVLIGIQSVSGNPLISLHSKKSPKTPPALYFSAPLQADWEKLETQLLEAGYSKLFVECDDSALNEIWKDGKNKEDLEELIQASEADQAAVFLAANLMMSKDWKPGTDELKATVATAYAKALIESKAPQGAYQGLTGNAWGLPIDGGDMGVLGERLISIGEVAVPYLQKALDDISMLAYEGSEEATIADMHIVRVVDVATRIVVRIKGFVWQWSSKPKVRDASIGFMREHLGF